MRGSKFETVPFGTQSNISDEGKTQDALMAAKPLEKNMILLLLLLLSLSLLCFIYFTYINKNIIEK